MSPSLEINQSVTHLLMKSRPKTENRIHLNLDRIKAIKGNLTHSVQMGRD